MHHCGIDGLEHQRFSPCLHNRRQCCKVNGASRLILGYHKETFFGSLLFLLYINDLHFALRKAHATMYADDTATYYSTDKIEEIDVVVNAELACLEKRLQGNKLSLNIVKTQAMIIGSAQKLGQINKTSEITTCFQVNGNDIELVH